MAYNSPNYNSPQYNNAAKPPGSGYLNIFDPLNGDVTQNNKIINKYGNGNSPDQQDVNNHLNNAVATKKQANNPYTPVPTTIANSSALAPWKLNADNQWSAYGMGDEWNSGFSDAPAIGADGESSAWSNWAWGEDGKGGNLMPSITAASGLAQGVLGYKALDLSEEQFAFAKQAYLDDSRKQGQTYNNTMNERQAARLKSKGVVEGSDQWNTEMGTYKSNTNIQDA